jgi:hypothetical protein
MTIATFDSRCQWCDLPIHEGDEIELYEDEWLHSVCAEEAAE